MCHQNHSSFLLNETGGLRASSLGLHNKWEADGRSKPRIAHSRPFPQVTWVFPTGNTNQKHPLRQLGYSGEDHAVHCSIWLISVPGLWEEPRMFRNIEHLSFMAVPPTILKLCQWRHPMVGLRVISGWAGQVTHRLKSCSTSLVSWVPDTQTIGLSIVCR